MKKKWFIFLFIFVLGLSFITNLNPLSFASADVAQNEFIIRAYGDSISAGYKLSDYDNYVSGKSQITKESYPEVFARKYIETFGGEAIGKGVSGDETWQLLEDLRPYIDGTASDMADFEETDIVTLCIGANNVLGVAMDNISTYLLGSLDDTAYRALLQEGLDQFIEDWPKILEAFEGKKVVAMTIYNPYRYASENFPSSLKNNVLLSGYVTKFENMLNISMEYLQDINDIIRASASKDVYIVDVWNLFDGFSNEEYSRYLNVNTADINITLNMLSDTSLLVAEFKEKCDPHPTAEGHNIIAQEHLNVFKYFKLSSQNSLTGIKDKKDQISLDLTAFENDTFTYKVYKKIDQNSSLIKIASTKTIAIDIEDITGDGEIYVEVYEGSNLIFTTDYLEYSISQNSHTISTQESLTGLADAGDKITIDISTAFGTGYSYKLYKQVSQITTLIGESTSSSIEVDVNYLDGNGILYVDVYKNGTLVDSTNSLPFDMVINTFEIEADTQLSDAVLDVIDEVVISVNAKDYTDCTFKYFRKNTKSTSLLQQSTERTLTIPSEELEGEGEIYVEVYKNGNKRYTTQSINYSVTINDFSISCREVLSGIMGSSNPININITAEKTAGYTFKLYKSSSGQTSLINEYNSPTISLSARELEGEGNIYVEVYKGNIKICTTENIYYDIAIGTFEISSKVDLLKLSNNQKVVINLKVSAIENPVYILYQVKDDVYTKLQTTSYGNFEIQTSQLEKEGYLYAEVYSNGTRVANTNNLQFKISSSQETHENMGEILLIVALTLIGVVGVVIVILIILSIKEKKKLWK